MVIFMKKKVELLMAVCLLFSAAFLAKQSAILVQSNDAVASQLCIVIDAGHGGSDPGKVGVNDALEKDINLSLALKLKKLLEQKDFSVVLTRDSDAGLYDEAAVNQKVDDMQKRCQIITEANPIFTVSLHQNSYPSPEIKGAQVFYYGQSAQGEVLANILQSSLISRVDPDNHRAAKANESYYLLKKTPTPTVIVECGFLSNPEEADLLLMDDYQNKLVRAIYMGILEYLETENYI
jgi:N-acetylmuramoyl-L-alanine amidase